MPEEPASPPISSRNRVDRRKLPKRSSATWTRLAARVLSPEELWSLLSACLRNAHLLASEAQLLLDAKSNARAYALAGTSLEETGKGTELVAIYVGLLAGYRFEADDWVKFWWRWYSHESKTEGAALFEIVIDRGVKKWSEAAEPPPSAVLAGQVRDLFKDIELAHLTEQGVQWHVSRQASLYVDWSSKVEEPEKLVSASHAAEMVKRAAEAATSMGYMCQAMEAIAGEPAALTWLLGFLEDLKSSLG